MHAYMHTHTRKHAHTHTRTHTHTQVSNRPNPEERMISIQELSELTCFTTLDIKQVPSVSICLSVCTCVYV